MDKLQRYVLLLEVPLPLDAVYSIITSYSLKTSSGNPCTCLSLALNTSQEEIIPVSPIQNNLLMFENKLQ